MRADSNAILFITELAYEQIEARAEFLSIATRNLKAKNNQCQRIPKTKFITLQN